MEETVIKIEEGVKPRKSGGRPLHDGWTLYHFEKVDGEKGKSVAKCIKCLNLLKNTTISRLLAHRKKCGRVSETMLNSSAIYNLQQSSTITDPASRTATIILPQPQIGKMQIEGYDEEHQPQQHQEILWTQTQNIDTFMDESVNSINPSAMDIVNEDIRRHRKSQTQQINQRRRSESSVIDSALSSFLIGCNLTFDIVDSKHFKNFVNALNSDYKIPSSSQLTSKVLSQLKGGFESSSGGERTRGGKKRKYYSSDDDSEYE